MASQVHQLLYDLLLNLRRHQKWKDAFPKQAIFLPSQALRLALRSSTASSLLDAVTGKSGPTSTATPLSPLFHVAIPLPTALQTTSHFISCFIRKGREKWGSSKQLPAFADFFVLHRKAFLQLGWQFKHNQEKPLLSTPIPLHLPAAQQRAVEVGLL